MEWPSILVDADTKFVFRPGVGAGLGVKRFAWVM